MPKIIVTNATFDPIFAIFELIFIDFIAGRDPVPDAYPGTRFFVNFPLDPGIPKPNTNPHFCRSPKCAEILEFSVPQN